jgi:hypothetical protein
LHQRCIFYAMASTSRRFDAMIKSNDPGIGAIASEFGSEKTFFRLSTHIAANPQGHNRTARATNTSTRTHLCNGTPTEG